MRIPLQQAPARPAHAFSGSGSAAAAALTALLLFSPIPPDVPLLHTPPAIAKELASGSGSRVNKDPRSLLRLGLPSQPKELRDVQAKLEEGEDNLNRLLINNAGSAVKEAKARIFVSPRGIRI